MATIKTTRISRGEVFVRVVTIADYQGEGTVEFADDFAGSYAYLAMIKGLANDAQNSVYDETHGVFLDAQTPEYIIDSF